MRVMIGYYGGNEREYFRSEKIIYRRFGGLCKIGRKNKFPIVIILLRDVILFAIYIKIYSTMTIIYAP